MLKSMRKHSGGLIGVLIIGAIALVFIFWGVGGRDSGAPEDIRVDGHPVSQRVYQTILDNVGERVREQKNGAALTPAETLEVRRRALALLIDRESLLALARGTGRGVSDEAINEAVKSDPSFHDEDGRFSLKIYEETVPRALNVSLAAFEANLAEGLLLSETEAFVKSLSFAPVGSVLDEYHFASDRLILDHVFFPDRTFPVEDEPAEEQIAAFHKEHEDRWRVPAKVSLAYVDLDVGQYLEGIEATDQEIEFAYLEESASLAKPEEAEARQILIRFPSLSPSPEDRASTEAKAMAALERAKTEDFKTLAGEISEDSLTGPSGGDMGTVRRGQNLPQVDEAVFGQGKDNLGQVVGPVETLFGYHLILVEKYRPARDPDLEEARDELTAMVTRRKARRAAVAKIEDLIAILPTNGLDAEVFAETARSIGLEPQETGLFSDPSDAPPFLAEDAELVQKALDTPIGKAGDPVDNPEHIVLYTPKEKTPSFVRPLEDETVRPEVVEAWREDMTRLKALAAAEEFIGSAAGTDWATLTAGLPEGAESGVTEPFERLKFYSAGARLTEADPAALLGQFFKLSRKGDLTEAPIRVEGGDKGYLVLAVSDLLPADRAALSDGEIANLQNAAKAALSDAGYSFWSSRRRSQTRLQLPQTVQYLINGQDLRDDVK